MTEYELSKSLLKKKAAGLPTLSYLKNGAVLLIYRLAMIVFCVSLYDKLDGVWQVVSILIIGCLLGATSQDIYSHYKGQKIWPVLSTLYDWNKIEEIAHKKTKDEAEI